MHLKKKNEKNILTMTLNWFDLSQLTEYKEGRHESKVKPKHLNPPGGWIPQI